MKVFFEQQKALLSKAINRACEREAGEVARTGSMGPELMRRIADFSCRGKMIRGALTAVGSGLAAGEPGPASLPLGAAMELFQSALLIHDDIMDRDDTRRGIPTIHHRYTLEASAGGAVDSGHLGESLGICAGDVAIFLAFSLIAEAGEMCGRTAELVRLCGREMNIVGTAQMLDVSWGCGWGLPSREEVLRLYRYKTGRYTFSLPLSAGALTAGATAELRNRLEEFGELTGIIFQIRDDELGLFGDESELGKPIGSDIAEGKRTIYYLTLRDRSSEAQKARIDRLFGGAGPVDGAVIAEVRELAERLGVREEVDHTVSSLYLRAGELLEELEGLAEHPDPWASYLRDLLDYVRLRKN